MSLLFGPIRQVAFVTRDIRASMDFYTRHMGVGPWFLADRAVHEQRYRGQPCRFSMSVALADADGLQIELMQQHDEVPTMYSAWTARPFARELQQHICHWPEDYDGTLARAFATGYRVLQDGATGRGRFIYLEHPGNPDQVVEFTETTPARRAFNEGIAAAARGWDGSDPVRPFAVVNAG